MKLLRRARHPLLELVLLTAAALTAGCGLGEAIGSSVGRSMERPPIAVINRTDQVLHVWLHIARPTKGSAAPALDLLDGPWEVPPRSVLLHDPSLYPDYGGRLHLIMVGPGGELLDRFSLGIKTDPGGGADAPPAWYDVPGGLLEVAGTPGDLSLCRLSYVHGASSWTEALEITGPDAALDVPLPRTAQLPARAVEGSALPPRPLTRPVIVPIPPMGDPRDVP
jgi:hypothetical protein